MYSPIYGFSVLGIIRFSGFVSYQAIFTKFGDNSYPVRMTTIYFKFRYSTHIFVIQFGTLSLKKTHLSSNLHGFC